MRKRKRDDLWKCLFYLCNIAVFKGLALHLGCEQERKKNGMPIWMRSRFCLHFGTICRVILGAKIVKIAPQAKICKVILGAKIGKMAPQATNCGSFKGLKSVKCRRRPTNLGSF